MVHLAKTSACPDRRRHVSHILYSHILCNLKVRPRPQQVHEKMGGRGGLRHRRRPCSHRTAGRPSEGARRRQGGRGARCRRWRIPAPRPWGQRKGRRARRRAAAKRARERRGAERPEGEQRLRAAREGEGRPPRREGPRRRRARRGRRRAAEAGRRGARAGGGRGEEARKGESGGRRRTEEGAPGTAEAIFGTEATPTAAAQTAAAAQGRNSTEAATAIIGRILQQ